MLSIKKDLDIKRRLFVENYLTKNNRLITFVYNNNDINFKFNIIFI